MRLLVCIAIATSLALVGCSTVESIPSELVSDTPEAVPGDDWPVASPSSVGVSRAALDAVAAQAELELPQTTNLLVVMDGTLIYERSFGTATNRTAVPVYSVSKSIASALVGIGIEDGTFTGVDQKLVDVLPAFAGADSRVQSATLADAMTMRVGLAPADDDIRAWLGSADYVQYVLDRPAIADPGTVFMYNTGLTHLISAAITAQRDESMEDYATRELFEPIGITSAQWQTDPQGITVGGTGLSLTPRDMARFGQLYLNGGTWEGNQIVADSWVRESTRQQLVNPDGLAYGYWWWPATWSLDGKELDVFSAIGYGGQRVVVVPALKAVIVVTTDVDPAPADNEKLAKGLAQTLLSSQ